MERNSNELNTIKWLKTEYGNDIQAELTSIDIDTKLKMDILCTIKNETYYVQVKSFTWYNNYNAVAAFQEKIRQLLENQKYVEHHEKLRNAKFAIYRNRDNVFTIEKFIGWDNDPTLTKEKKQEPTEIKNFTAVDFAEQRLKESRNAIKNGWNAGKIHYHNISPMAFVALFNKEWNVIVAELGDDLVMELKYHFDYWVSTARWVKQNEDVAIDRNFYEFLPNTSGIVKDNTFAEDVDFESIKVIKPLESNINNKGGNLDEYLPRNKN